MDNEKTYKEALERAKARYDKNPTDGYVGYTNQILEEIFPELKESEDERVRKILIHIVKGACDKYGIKYRGNEIGQEKLLAYLERQKEQKPAEWGEEDEELFELLHTCVCRCISDPYWSYVKREDVSKRVIPFLEKLKSLHPQPKEEWNEEDEKKRNAIIGILDFQASKCQGRICATDGFLLDELISWLKFLRPQPHWKPSENMLNALKWAKSEFHPDCPETMAQLNALYNELNNFTMTGIEYMNTVCPTTSKGKDPNREDVADAFEDGIAEGYKRRWKPSEEQMNALYNIIHPADPVNRHALESLYDDLKKL